MYPKGVEKVANCPDADSSCLQCLHRPICGNTCIWGHQLTFDLQENTAAPTMMDEKMLFLKINNIQL